MRKFSAAEPLVLRTAIVAVLTSILHVAVVMGYVPVDVETEGALAGVIDAAGAAIAVWWARRAVSPVPAYEPRHSENSEPVEELPVEEAAA